MKTNIRKIRKHRTYTTDFKQFIVGLYESGEYTVGQIEKLYVIAPTQIYDWIYKFSKFNEKGAIIVEMKDSNQNKVKELSNKVKELEQIVGQKQITIDYLEKMMQLAKEDFDIDIKKNYSSQQSSGSKLIKKK